jgi:hypothetical protein
MRQPVATRSIYVLAVAFLLTVLATVVRGCGTAVAPRELPGTYEAHYPFGKATLTLDSDGRYEQVLRIGDQTASATGNWRYLAERQCVFYQGCLSATDGFGKLNEQWNMSFPGACVVPVTRRFLVAGAVEIGGDEEYHYRKTSK